MELITPENEGIIANVSFVIGAEAVTMIDTGGLALSTSSADFSAMYGSRSRIRERPAGRTYRRMSLP
jgi:hypothetical protein